MDVIEGDGTSFASVEYVPLTGGPGVELVIGRQLSTDVLQSLCAYSYTGGHVVELLSTNYSEYRCVDLDEDGRTDLFVLRFDAEQPQGVAELYRWQGDQMEREPEAYLTAGASPVKRIVSGDLMEDVPAVFVASAYEENGLATDVFAFRDGVFRNITAADPGSALPPCAAITSTPPMWTATDSSSCRRSFRCRRCGIGGELQRHQLV